MAAAGGLIFSVSRINGITDPTVLAFPIVFPVTLNDLTISETSEHTDYISVTDGEFSQAPSGRSLQVIDDLQTLAISWDAPWLVGTRLQPEELRDILLDIMRAKTPVKIIARNSGNVMVDIGRLGNIGEPFYATVRGVSTVLRQRERDTRYFTVSIKEWRAASSGRQTTNRARAAGSAGTFSLPTKHKLTATDTFSTLSHLYYGTYEGAKTIMRANGFKSWGPTTEIVKSSKFKVGDQIKIPVPKFAVSVAGAGSFNSGSGSGTGSGALIPTGSGLTVK